MRRRSRANYGRAGGFTLVELIVASTLMTIVLTGVYTTFSSAIRTWRSAEVNYQTYEDARRAFGILTRELRSVPQDALHLVNGGEDWIEFVTLASPMRVETASTERLLKVRYRLRPDEAEGGMVLTREEAVVKGPLPLPVLPGERRRGLEVKVGRSYGFTLASGVEALSLYYVWAEHTPRPAEVPPDWADLVGDFVVEERLPEGIEIVLELYDPGVVDAAPRAIFTDTVVFRGETSPMPRYLSLGQGGGDR